jgi:tetratricopeptide (TPR) repeat protein
MDAIKSLDELKAIAPTKADWSYVPIVAAALRSKATYLRITFDQSGTTFDFDGAALPDAESLLQMGLTADHATTERHLAAGLYALNLSDPMAVSYESWNGSQGTRLKIEAGKVKVEKYNRAPWKESNVNHRIRVTAKKGWKPFGGLFGGGSGKLDMTPPEVKVLEDLCRFAPIPIEVNKNLISKPVNMGRSLVCMVLEPPADHAIQRLNVGKQETLDQTTAEAGQPYSAVVAVGGNNPGLSTLNLVVDGLLAKQEDPSLSAMGIRCVITCPELELTEEGTIVENEAYARVIDDLTRKSLKIGDRLAEVLVDMSALDRVEAADYVKYYADRHEAAGEFDDAEQLFERLLEAQEEALGDDDPELAGTLLKIAALQEQQGHYDKARQSYQRVLELFEDIRPDQAVIAACHAGLASLGFAQEKLEEAEHDAQIALDLRKAHLDPNDLQLGVSYELLARVFRARYQYPERKFLEVDTLYLQAIRIFERNFGQQHLDVATLVFDLAEHRRAQRRYREAEPLFKRALTIRKQNLGEDDEVVAETLDSLGGLYEEQGRCNQAGEAYTQALEIWEALLGPEHEDVVRRLNNLVVLYRLYGKFAQAEPLYERILGLHSDGADPVEAAQDHSNLALLHAAQGKYEKAEAGLLQAQELLAQHTGEDVQSEQAWVLDQLGDVLLQQDRFDDSEQRLLEAQALWNKVLGEEHLDHCVNLELLGRLFTKQRKWDQAEKYFRRSVELKEKLLGPIHRETICVLGSLAETLRGAHREEESQAMHREVLLRRAKAQQQYEQNGNAEKPAAEVQGGGRYSAARREAEVYAQQADAPSRVYKRYNEAEHLYLRALFTQEQALGPNHPDISYALDDLAELYKRHRKFEAAVELCQRTLALRRKALGMQHPDVCLGLIAQIDILCTQQRWSAAEPLTREWLAVVEATVGETHPETAKVLETQARIYGAAGALEKQEECNRRALEVRRQALGTEHPDFAMSLADLLCLQKKYEEAGRLYSFVVSSLEENLGSESAELIPIYEKYAGVLRKLNKEALAVELETQAMVMRVQHGLDFGDQ